MRDNAVSLFGVDDERNKNRNRVGEREEATKKRADEREHSDGLRVSQVKLFARVSLLGIGKEKVNLSHVSSLHIVNSE